MRQASRISGAHLIGAGVLGLAWALVVWQWQDPITALYTTYQQHKLAESFEATVAAYKPTSVVSVRAKSTRTRTVNVKAEHRRIALDAARYRNTLKIGGPVGRLRIPRLGSIICSDDVGRLKCRGYEQVAPQACHPASSGHIAPSSTRGPSR